uniref:Si:ch211-168d1.3 n=1 Tax=Stegastes partitus TaxID=144197 RepID=A0A3B4ZGT9_9TELE
VEKPKPARHALFRELLILLIENFFQIFFGSQRSFSVLDRLLLTHPVWLQLSLKQDTALYILLREPVGTFLVRKCSSSQRKVLCLRVTADRSASSVKECFILNYPEVSDHTYAQVCFFCICRDVLPFPLQLPEAIAKATTHRQLEAISHMGQDHFAIHKNVFTHDKKISCKIITSLLFQTPAKVEEPPKPRQDTGIEVAVLAGDRRAAPSLAELDSSSSFSSMDEDNDSDSDPESMTKTQMHTYKRPPLVRGRGRGGLHRMSEAFVCFFAPDKRLTRLVEELSRDRRSIFGGTVQDFLLEQREVLKSLTSTSSSSSSARVTSVQLLQGLRLFLSQAKCCLLDSGELEPPIETLFPQTLTSSLPLSADLALERAMFSCVLRPLKSHLEKALIALHSQDGSSQCLTQNMLHLKGDAAMERLGVRTGVPDSREVERVKQKLILMQRTHSPIDKVLLLLQVCKCVHKAMGSLHGEIWDDFLPSLSYVIVECSRPHILIEVEYMMELLEPSWLGGEGMTKLILVHPRAVLCYIFTLFSLSISSPPTSLPPSLQRCVRILFQDGERSAVRTLQWRAGETSQALAQLCASTFGVSDPQQYTLYWRSGGEMRALPPQAQPQDLASHSEGGPSLSYLRTDHDFSKMRRLTRGGAVDLSESEGGRRRRRRRRRWMVALAFSLFLSLVLSLSLRRCVVSRRGSGLVVKNYSPSPDQEQTLIGKLFPKRTNMQSRAGPT